MMNLKAFSNNLKTNQNLLKMLIHIQRSLLKNKTSKRRKREKKSQKFHLNPNGKTLKKYRAKN